MLEAIDYKKIFTYFEEISSIPRGSGHNEKISGYLADFAREHGLEYRVDDALNVIIKKPASGAVRGAAKDLGTVMLQGHMDMVCVSEGGAHDFQSEGLPLRIDGDFIYSEGTTLGGDDGIALAYMLAILDGDYTHPPLEAVFTTDEEVGMTGASALDVSDLEAKMLINIDNEEEGVLLVSCAGGASVDVEFTGSRSECVGSRIEVSVSGLAGGHSGTEIGRHPTNASVVLGRLLASVYDNHPFSLISFEGGDKDNVITKAATAHILCAGDAGELVRELSDRADRMKDELNSHEPGFTATVVQLPGEKTGVCFDGAFTETVLSYLNLTITGVQMYSGDVPGMVESSLNLGVAKTDETGMKLAFSVRSQKKGYKEYMIGKLSKLASLCAQNGVGQTVRVRGDYPAWDYKKDSELRDRMVEEFRNCFGREPRVEGIHAGLECGILSEKMPGLDIVSVGPNIFDIHTAKERMSISSAKNNFDYIVCVLEKLAGC